MATGVSYPVGAIADRGGHKAPGAARVQFPELCCRGCVSRFLIDYFACARTGLLFGGTAAGAVEVAETALAGDQLPARQRGSGFGLLAAVNGVGDFVASI